MRASIALECQSRVDSSEMDINKSLLRRNVEYYQQIRSLRSNDFFIVRYTPTDNQFVLRKTELKDFPDLKIFENEFNLTNQLKHKNLLSFVTSFVSGSQLWTIMPFTEFQSLADLSAPFGLSEEAIAFVMRDVLKAVEYLHNNCIIHHSIRSSHILLFGSPKTEFRCVLSGLKYSINMIRNGQIMKPVFDYPIDAQNNINWMAPEVLEQNLMGYDTKADIYSIGITCCELSNGSAPFAGLEAPEVLLNKLNGETPEPMDSNSIGLRQYVQFIGLNELSDVQKAKYDHWLSRTLSNTFKKFVVESCLHPDPNERYDASQLLSHSFIEKRKKGIPNNFLSKFWNFWSHIRPKDEEPDNSEAIKALMASIHKNFKYLQKDIKEVIKKSFAEKD